MSERCLECGVDWLEVAAERDLACVRAESWAIETDKALARVKDLETELQGYRDYEREGAQWILSLPASATFNHNRRDGAAEPCTICRLVAERDAALARVKELENKFFHEPLKRVAELEGALREIADDDSRPGPCDECVHQESARAVLEGKKT